MFDITTTQVFSYIIALGLAAIIPGPGMIALVTRSIDSGARSGFAMLVGLMAGDIIYLSIAVFGLAVIISNFHYFFDLINILAALYLAILAYQFWNYKPQAIQIQQKNKAQQLLVSCFAGLGLTLSNPKTIAFYLAILPLVISLKKIDIKIWGIILVPITLIVLSVVGSLFILFALKMKLLLKDVGTQQLLFKIVAIIMLCASMALIKKLI